MEVLRVLSSHICSHIVLVGGQVGVAESLESALREWCQYGHHPFWDLREPRETHRSSVRDVWKNSHLIRHQQARAQDLRISCCWNHSFLLLLWSQTAAMVPSEHLHTPILHSLQLCLSIQWEPRCIFMPQLSAHNWGYLLTYGNNSFSLSSFGSETRVLWNVTIHEFPWTNYIIFILFSLK